MQSNAELTPEQDDILHEQVSKFYADPLGFVMYAYDWIDDKSIQIVELEEPYLSRFQKIYGPELKYGPDVWSCEHLDDIGKQVKENKFDGRTPVEPIREAVSSGHGIGKSAETGWLTNWIMSTRPYAQGTITANTSTQLETKTWAQIVKWTSKCITSHWFKVTAGKGNMRMERIGFEKEWFCSAQTCREENSESFAGQHAANSTSFYINDEGSAVPNKIYEVQEGGLTDGEPMQFTYGNPTKNTGKFFEMFNRMKHRYNTRVVDSRDVKVTNKKTIQEWIDDYGEDSDFVKVRVRGVFPSSSSMQFIPSGDVNDSMNREAPDVSHSPVIFGVDVARFGDDQSVIYIRRGLDGRTMGIFKYRGLDLMTFANVVAEKINEYHHWVRAVFVDESGIGAGVADRLQQMGYNMTIGVNFASRSPDRHYINMRAYMWGKMRDYVKQGGCLPNDPELESDLTGIEYGYRASDNAVQLEKKEDMKKRGLSSPDIGDALALTFAQPVAPLDSTGGIYAGNKIEAEYDPYEDA